MQYIIDAFSPEEMCQWLATVKYCMRKRDGLNDDIRLFILLFVTNYFYFYSLLIRSLKLMKLFFIVLLAVLMVY